MCRACHAPLRKTQNLFVLQHIGKETSDGSGWENWPGSAYFVE